MPDIPMRAVGAVTKSSVMSINEAKVQGARDRNNISGLNRAHAVRGSAPSSNAVSHQNQTRTNGGASAPAPQGSRLTNMVIPQMRNVAKKGQKIALEGQRRLTKIKARLGWNVKNPACDVNVSAFLLSGNRVISDDWFVFYGQQKSPDGSTLLSSGGGADREEVSIDFSKLDGRVDKIVFVLTIHEALEKRLNFSMIKDAYIRIMDAQTNDELVGFLMDEYYENVTSMMIGEVYRHNGMWKFNAVGNGVARDLAGLCEFYGVQVD